MQYFKLLLSLFLLCYSAVGVAVADLAADTEALLLFKDSADLRGQLSWSPSVSTCQWDGIQCSSNSTIPRVIAVRLPGSGLFGAIPSETIGRLDQLVSLSLRSNKLSGALPDDITNLGLLRSLALQSNNFSGPLPANLSGWPHLVRLELAFNGFSGLIPPSLVSLTHLRFLDLQNNSFSGPLPAINTVAISEFNVANNRLNGSLPDSVAVAKFPLSAFAGNDLCGGPLPACNIGNNGSSSGILPSIITPPGKRKKLGIAAIIGIVLGAAAFLAFLLLLCCCLLRRRSTEKKEVVLASKKDVAPDVIARASDGDFDSPAAAFVPSVNAVLPSSANQDTDKNKLVFFEPNRFAFHLEDLLRASAEVLGKGSVGTAYKAVLENGLVVAVKRLRDVVIERKDFERQMELMGRLNHANLVPLRAYYFSKDEKLLVYDYVPMGSLSSLLHGNKGVGCTVLDWETRVHIAHGVAQGIAFLHGISEPGCPKLGHGNIKSSNILLDNHLEACLSDYGLAQLVGSSPAAISKVGGYRAPEVTDVRRVNQKADVYSFGVLLLELLTGKAPAQATVNDDGIDLPRWVNSVVREEWTAEVFDYELMRFDHVEEEMVQMLQVAMNCVSPSPDQRPSMEQVTTMIQDVRKTHSKLDYNNHIPTVADQVSPSHVDNVPFV